MGSKRLTNDDHQKEWPVFLTNLNIKISKKLSNPNSIQEPTLIKMVGKSSETKLHKLINENEIVKIHDIYNEQLAELFISENSQLYKANHDIKANSIKEYLASHFGNKKQWQLGTWVYYPWSKSIVHILQEEDFFKLLTLRNGVLITKTEQQILQNSQVGCLGMSVGSNGAYAIELTNSCKEIRLADGAVLSGSNLNRVNASLLDTGSNKAVVTKQKILERNPYVKVHVYTNNIDKESIDKFLTYPTKLEVVVDEIDEIEVKVLLRSRAREYGIPVVMVTEPDNSLILDVERYDLNPNLELFHGLAGNIEHVANQKNLSQREFIKHASKIIGVENMSYRGQKSMLEVGSTMPSAPQLGTTAMIAGGVIGYAVRQIVLGNPIKSGRTVFSLDDLLLEPRKRTQRKEHKQMTKVLKKAIDSM